MHAYISINPQEKNKTTTTFYNIPIAKEEVLPQWNNV
jgi:hypothetical protein